MVFHRDPDGTWLATLHWGKSGPPRRGWSVTRRGGVARLARATSPRCTLLLATTRHRPITVGQSYVLRL